MRQLRMYIILAMMLAVSAKRHEPKLSTAVEHRINKREDIVNKHQRDPGKLFGQTGKLHPVLDAANTTRLYDVRQIDGKSRGARNSTQPRNYHGLLQLAPPSHFAHRSYNARGQRLVPRDGRNRGRYPNPRPRTQRSKQGDGLAGTLSRWFFSDDSEELQETSSRKFLSRHSSHRPSTYYNYPPFWSSGTGSHKPNSFPRFQKSRAISHRPVTNNQIKFVKNDCNACNSVPWTPILKPSAVHHPSSFGDSGSYGVPTIDVHHDSSGYDTSHKQSILPPPPAPVVEHSPDSTIPASYGLPLGNIPTAHGLLPPINHHNVNPTGLVPPPPTILNPVPTDGLLHSIPFPELSPVPIVPLHNSNQFLQVETGDLVPPIPPQKSVSNVIFTISENGPGPSDPIDNHITHGPDQHSDSSSLINSHLLSHIQGPYGHRFNPTNNHVNLDIVKSVPVAEYTSSIEYPLQVIQSPQYIDITTLPNATKTATQTYEKEPQTGSQKISDILFGLVKDTAPKKPPSDSQISGTKVSTQSSQLPLAKPEQTNQYRQTNTPVPSEVPKSNYVEAEHVFHPNHQYTSNLIQTDVYGPQPNLVWSGAAQHTPEQAQFASGNVPAFVNPPPHQPKFETGGDELLPDPTSTSWLLPAQSNIAPQWILPVSNPPAVPYPLLPGEEGIASAVNEELSPTPPPQPMNNSKTKKVQIIIPYTTGENKEYDQSILESAHTEIQKIPVVKNASQVSALQSAGATSTGQHVAEFTVKGNATQNSKFLNDVHHILALNIKELLKDEVEAPKTEQNIRLQKNIDNWTALEYSNHKTVAKKEPLDVISYANAVTSIPGTSINHLLITSKKIPDKYLTTTPLPNFDEPTTGHYAGSSVSVESKPFTTKTYDTSGLYSTVTRIAPTTTTLKTIIQDVLREQPNKNHRNGYSEVSKTKANQWGKLNENLVVPERVSNNTFDPSQVTKAKDEKVYVVTPVSVWESNGADSNKRTTRQVTMTEKPELESVTITPEATKAYIAKLFGNKTERAKISKFNKPKPIQKFFPTTKSPPPWNATKVEVREAAPATTTEDGSKAHSGDHDTDAKSINDVFPFRNGGELPVELAVTNTTTEEIRVQGFGVRKGLVKQVKVNKNLKNSKKEKAQTTTTEGPEATTTSTKSSQKPAVESKTGDNSTHNGTSPVEGVFGRKIVKGDKKNSRSKDEAGLAAKKDESEKLTSNLPPGIFGETKRIRVTPNDDNYSPSVAALNETIRLLKEYLGASEEIPEEKTDATELFEEEDRP